MGGKLDTGLIEGGLGVGREGVVGEIFFFFWNFPSPCLPPVYLVLSIMRVLYTLGWNPHNSPTHPLTPPPPAASPPFTVVVLSCMKKAPLCTERKCARKRLVGGG